VLRLRRAPTGEARADYAERDGANAWGAAWRCSERLWAAFRSRPQHACTLVAWHVPSFALSRDPCSSKGCRLHLQRSRAAIDAVVNLVTLVSSAGPPRPGFGPPQPQQQPAGFGAPRPSFGQPVPGSQVPALQPPGGFGQPPSGGPPGMRPLGPGDEELCISHSG
jgi:hypothetical protein